MAYMPAADMTNEHKIWVPYALMYLSRFIKASTHINHPHLSFAISIRWRSISVFDNTSRILGIWTDQVVYFPVSQKVSFTRRSYYQGCFSNFLVTCFISMFVSRKIVFKFLNNNDVERTFWMIKKQEWCMCLPIFTSSHYVPNIWCKEYARSAG